LLYAGFARGDVVRLGKQHVSNGVITFKMEKPRGDDGYVYPPVLDKLAASIDATKTGDVIFQDVDGYFRPFLVGERGEPYTKESFGNMFREWCREAGCPGSAHGLRKAAATRFAEAGATVSNLMPRFGWKTEKMALYYTKKANRKRLAAEAAKLLLR